MNIIPFESDASRQIRFEIVTLSKDLELIENDINTFHQAIYAFEREYHQRLGDLSEVVLSLRIQLGINEEKQEQVVAVTTYLAEQEYHTLKTVYRQAAKLCHPDYLAYEYRKQGLDLFDKLNKAYHLQDIVTVENILWLLQSGQAFIQKNVIIIDKILLKRRQKLLKEMIEQKQDQLASLKRQEEYDISNRDNWNILLYDYQTRLEDELAILRGRAKTK